MGPDDDKDSFLQTTLINLIKKKDLILSTGEQYFDVVALEDCIYGYYLICIKGRPDQTYWVGSGDPRRLKDYVKRMCKIFSSKNKTTIWKTFLQ